MFEILVAMDFDARLVRALESARHGNVGSSSPFGELLAELGVIPSAYTAIGWKKHLSRFPSPTKGSDFERHGLPVLVVAIREFLDGDDTLIKNVKSTMNAAIEDARNARRAARIERSGHPEANEPRRVQATSATNALEARIDDALSLLEGAAASNHLSSAQRTRAIDIANRVSQFKPFATSPRPGVMPMSRPADASNVTRPQPPSVTDASKTWGPAIRDHGQFGSFPAFDDMGDESTS